MNPLLHYFTIHHSSGLFPFRGRSQLQYEEVRVPSAFVNWPCNRGRAGRQGCSKVAAKRLGMRKFSGFLPKAVTTLERPWAGRKGWKKKLANLWRGKRIRKKAHAGRGQETKWELSDKGSNTRAKY